MVTEVKIAVECSQSRDVPMKALGSTVESVCMYVAHTLQRSLLYILYKFQPYPVGSDKSPAGARSTILLDSATEISCSKQFPTNQKSHKQE